MGEVHTSATPRTDITATSGIFDSSSKSLGVTLLDVESDGWPDLFVANDTQPNKLYRNLRNGTFRDVAVEAGLAVSADGRARAGMGVDAADFDPAEFASDGSVAITSWCCSSALRVRKVSSRPPMTPESTICMPSIRV